MQLLECKSLSAVCSDAECEGLPVGGMARLVVSCAGCADGGSTADCVPLAPASGSPRPLLPLSPGVGKYSPHKSKTYSILTMSPTGIIEIKLTPVEDLPGLPEDIE